MDALPLTANDLYTARTIHGHFADALRALASNAADFDVRKEAHGLLKKFPLSACRWGGAPALVAGGSGWRDCRSMGCLPADMQHRHLPV